MSFVPLLLREFSRPMRMMEQQLKLMDDLFRPAIGSYINHPRLMEHSEQDTAFEDKEKFQIQLNLQDFKPEQITIKTMNNNTIQIEAKHEEKQDENGFVLKHIVRRFAVPKGHDLQKASSALTSDGLLVITTPKIPKEEKTIPITHEQTDTN
ncbi:heat shock protein 23-like [Diorhabda carinulata]|uniref:heat shock protein 23-like n=1 Tax=Diorhabda carinulata TaxID=1163345 RepID=UPI0025A17834|nr:heat shock protein 23-like [Diorhabda carinulata]